MNTPNSTEEPKKTILIIDDDLIINEMVRYALKPLIDTIHVDIETDITPALSEISPDLILVDLRLPSSTDAGTLLKLRQIFPSQAIVPISGVTPLKIHSWIETYKLEPFLSKDHLLRDLLTIVQTYIK